MGDLPAWIQRLANLGIGDEDTAEERALKRLQVLMAWASVPMIGLWGATFHAVGRPDLAAWPYGYCAVTLLFLLYLRLGGPFEPFRVGHLAWVLVAPYAFHLRLGGFLGSGGAILWSLLVPVASILFLGPRRSRWWFGAFVLLLLGSGLREGPLWAPPELSRAQLSFQFGLNTLGMAAFVYLASRYFVARMEAERARAEGLLRNILPASIAERLKASEEEIADAHPEVTVLFSDIVGFTRLSQSVTPEELVRMLNEVFREFDARAAALGVEKIKTIGDAYMVASGVPAARGDHAVAAARMAQAMIQTLEALAGRFERPLAMRIGLHTGPVVAGVIGSHKFAYDLWGDTVNTASRMESHGEPGRIHLSEATARALRDHFEVEERGTVEVKGKGPMRTFWLGRPRDARGPAGGRGHGTLGTP